MDGTGGSLHACWNPTVHPATLCASSNGKSRSRGSFAVAYDARHEASGCSSVFDPRFDVKKTPVGLDPTEVENTASKLWAVTGRLFGGVLTAGDPLEHSFVADKGLVDDRAEIGAVGLVACLLHRLGHFTY